MTWLRYRFKSQAEDNRPLVFPPPGPWWESGYGGGWDADDDTADPRFTQLIVYLPKGVELKDYWPEAYDLDDVTEHAEITFSSRFPKPDWFNP